MSILEVRVPCDSAKKLKHLKQSLYVARETLTCHKYLPQVTVYLTVDDHFPIDKSMTSEVLSLHT